MRQGNTYVYKLCKWKQTLTFEIKKLYTHLRSKSQNLNERGRCGGGGGVGRWMFSKISHSDSSAWGR
jgi:hypothetical protein